MTLLHTVPYLRKNSAFTSADAFGYWVAHQDIIHAVLRNTEVDGVHFYLPFPREYSRAEIPEGLRVLKSEYPNREIETKRVSEIPQHARIREYVLLDDFDSFVS